MKGYSVLSWRDRGVAVSIDDSAGVNKIALYAPETEENRNLWDKANDETLWRQYRGELPFGLTFGDGRGDVARKLGKPDSSTQFTDVYKDRGLAVEYRQTRGKKSWSEIAYIAITPAFRQAYAEAGSGFAAASEGERIAKQDKRRFPISVTQVKEVLGPSTDGDNFVYYRDELRVEVSEVRDLMEVMVERAGMTLASKLFGSNLFTNEEGKELVRLLRAKGGSTKVGRFEVTAKESIVVDGAVTLTIKVAQ